MERKTLRMFSKIVLLLGLLVVTYTAPVELDESDGDSQTLRFESADGVKREEEGIQKHIERKYEGVGIVPIKFHSYSASSDGTDGTKVVVAAKTNRSNSDHLPTPPPMPEHKLHRLLTALKNAGFFAALKRSYFCISKMNADGRNAFDFESEDGNKKLCERGSQKQVGPKPVRSASENNADGSYSYSFESADGTKMEESGNQKQVGPKPEDIGTVSRGSYSFTTSDGVVLTVNWVADENGFQATGDHLPTPPPMPEHKLKYEINPIDGDHSVIEKKDDGSNSFSFSESGSQRQVGPKPKNIGKVNRGSYSDSILDNTAVNWVTDENWFNPSD